MLRYLFLALVLAACSGAPTEHKPVAAARQQESDKARQEVVKPEAPVIAVNDTLNTMAGLIAGSLKTADVYTTVAASEAYTGFHEHFSKRWQVFDSTRITKLTAFRSRELDPLVKPETTLFYPFSGPDILHAVLFFPNAEKYVLVGLEPVGTLPEFHNASNDSLEHYYATLNTSLNAILNFSFFRTESMASDLKNMEIDGTLHLLMLFLNRTGNAIVSVKPLTVDSTGRTVYVSSLDSLKTARLKTKGVEVQFRTRDNRLKELQYFSVNASDYTLRYNKGFGAYLAGLNHFNVYLKGASYLLHKPTFSMIRNRILTGASTVVQDDSGIAVNYFKKDSIRWDFHLYGQYSKPIKMFAKHYQPLLDTMYRQSGSTRPLDFGLGYNYRDKNSNFMVVTRH